MNFRFRAFRAINEPETCLRFKDEHRNVLKEYGITNITTNSDAWMYNPDIYCVVAESGENSRVVGGVRLQFSTSRGSLPVEMAIGRMDKQVYELVEKYRQNGGVAEICALWNAKAVAGSGISRLLIRAGVAASRHLRVKTLLSICADYTLKMFQSAGFREIKSGDGKEGYPYPNKSYVARILALDDLEELSDADIADRERISSLRINPVQTYVEEEQGHQINLTYNLVITD